MNEEREKALYESEVMYGGALTLFGIFLRWLCLEAYITQEALEERGVKYREYLFVKGYRKPGYVYGALDQKAISYVMNGKRWPAQDQVEIWMHVIEDALNSEEYKRNQEKREKTLFVLTKEFQEDMYHLVGLAAPWEIVAAYGENMPRLEKILPRLADVTSKSPHRQTSFSAKTEADMLRKENPIPQEEI